MDEQSAVSVAQALGGETWQSGGGIWLVLCRRSDGAVVAISNDVVCEYESEEALEAGEARLALPLH